MLTTLVGSLCALDFSGGLWSYAITCSGDYCEPLTTFSSQAWKCGSISTAGTVTCSNQRPCLRNGYYRDDFKITINDMGVFTNDNHIINGTLSNGQVYVPYGQSQRVRRLDSAVSSLQQRSLPVGDVVTSLAGIPDLVPSLINGITDTITGQALSPTVSSAKDGFDTLLSNTLKAIAPPLENVVGDLENCDTHDAIKDFSSAALETMMDLALAGTGPAGIELSIMDVVVIHAIANGMVEIADKAFQKFNIPLGSTGGCTTSTASSTSSSTTDSSSTTSSSTTTTSSSAPTPGVCSYYTCNATDYMRSPVFNGPIWGSPLVPPPPCIAPYGFQACQECCEDWKDATGQSGCACCPDNQMGSGCCSPDIAWYCCEPPLSGSGPICGQATPYWEYHKVTMTPLPDTSTTDSTTTTPTTITITTTPTTSSSCTADDDDDCPTQTSTSGPNLTTPPPLTTGGGIVSGSIKVNSTFISSISNLASSHISQV